jgi:HEAT repeat protein
MVRILNTDGKTAGSGFIIRADGYLVTCHHVIYLLESLTVEYLGQQYSAEWCEELSNPEVDIAILKIPVKDTVAVSIINPPELETAVTVYGFPPKQEKFFPEGFPVAGENIQPSAPLNVLATYRTPNITANNPWNKLPQPDANFLSHRINAKVDAGTSGGPVLATDFEGVVGVIQCSKSDESYLIRWDNILDKLDKLGLEPKKNAVCDFLTEIEDNFKHIKLFHTQQPIVLTDQYIPIQVTLERRYKKLTEDIGSYAESEAELKQAYALKGIHEESQQTQVDWKKAKKDHEKIVMLADPGMGKSTLLRMEALTTAQQERQKLENQQTVDEIIFPIFLRLSEIAKTDAEVFDIIPDLIKLNHVKTFEKVKHILQQKLKQGNCLLLLDALDEVPTEQRITLIEKLSRFTRNYPCKIISTSRIVGYGGSPVENAKEVEIVPFSQQQTENYIQTWFNNAKEHLEEDSVSAEGLIQELENKPQINGLAQNPLLLSLLCSLYQTKGLILPARKAQVYEQAVNYMLSDWRNDNRRLASELGWVVAKKKLLAALAYQFSSKGQEVFGEEELWDKINTFLQSENIIDFRNTTPTELIRELTEEDGIIQKLDRTGDRYLFLHRTFQEYFTASYLNQSQDISLAKPLFWNYNQHETLTLLAGMMKDPIPLITAIYNEKDDIFKTQLLLAGRCIAECGEISHPIVTEIISKIYQFWLKYPDLSFIQSTMVMLGQGLSKAVAILMSDIQDEDSSVIINTINILSKVGNNEAIKALVPAFKHQDKDVIRNAATALGKIGKIRSAKAVEILIANLQHEDSYVRDFIVSALGEISNPKTIRSLIFVLLNDSEDIYVRGTAAYGLGKIRTSEAVSPLISALYSDSFHPRYTYVRQASAIALGKIATTQAVEALISALSHQKNVIRICAVEGLSESVVKLNVTLTHQVTESLIIALKDEDYEVRTHAAWVLGELKDSQTLSHLIFAFNDQSFNVRKYAVGAVKKLGTPEAIEALIHALSHKNQDVRLYAAWGLARLGYSQGMENLISILNNKNEDSPLRDSAAKALGEIVCQEAVPPLIECLQDEYSLVRRDAAEALGKIGSVEAVQPLIERLGDEEWNVRSNAAEALGKIGSEQAVPPLIECLQDEYSLVRRDAAEALGKIGSVEAVQLLIERLGDENSNIRSNAAEALGKIGSVEAVQPLIERLGDEDSDVRKFAAEALVKIGSVEVLKQLIQNPTVDIYESELFAMARKLAVQFSNKKELFSKNLNSKEALIPVYPERVRTLTSPNSSTASNTSRTSFIERLKRFFS